MSVRESLDKQKSDALEKGRKQKQRNQEEAEAPSDQIAPVAKIASPVAPVAKVASPVAPAAKIASPVAIPLYESPVDSYSIELADAVYAHIEWFLITATTHSSKSASTKFLNAKLARHDELRDLIQKKKLPKPTTESQIESLIDTLQACDFKEERVCDVFHHPFFFEEKDTTCNTCSIPREKSRHFSWVDVMVPALFFSLSVSCFLVQHFMLQAVNGPLRLLLQSPDMFAEFSFAAHRMLAPGHDPLARRHFCDGNKFKRFWNVLKAWTSDSFLTPCVISHFLPLSFSLLPCLPCTLSSLLSTISVSLCLHMCSLLLF
jgi:hypothetical protein